MTTQPLAMEAGAPSLHTGAPLHEPAPLERAHALELLRDMVRIRRLEEKCAELYSAGKIRGFLHLYIGEEAVATGVLHALEPDDAVVATYREHGHALVKGVPAGAIMAEMYGKAEGCSGGRGGSMHLFAVSRRFYGGNAIVGGGLPISVGLGLSSCFETRQRIVACFFGEGAMAEGEFHEAINLASLWRLPVLFVCENNLYAMGTALERSEAEPDLRARAESYNLMAESVDGMDVIAMERAARRAVDHLRSGQGPYFLEARTYRFRPHSMFDAELYRDKWEIEAWKHRDPLVLFPERLRMLGLLEAGDLERIEADASAEISDAVRFAEAGTWEPVEQLTRHVYTDVPRPSPAAAPPSTGAALSSPGPERPSGEVPGSASGEPTPASSPGAPDRVRSTYREAVRAGLVDALKRDPRVFLMGEDVGRYGGCYAVSKGLFEMFGPERIRDTPLSESGFVGAGIGAAIGGMRPIVEVMTVNFSMLALDQILNNAATLLHMSGGQVHVPLVIRMATGAGRQIAAQHSHSLEGWYAHIPGIKVLAPATLEDARGMLWTALEDPDPVLIFEHMLLYNLEGELAADAGPVDIDRARVRRPGRDITLITYGGMLWKTLEAAERLAKEGIEAEVIDLRTLRPLDTATILASVSRTRRAVIVDEAWRSGSISAEVSARIMEEAFYELDAPVGRVCSAEVPMPYPKHLEEAALPQVDTIMTAVRERVSGHV